MRLAREAGLALASAFGSYALAFWLMQILPDSAIATLGFGAADAEVRAGLIQDRSLWAGVGGLLQGDLGTTLDGTPVTAELGGALLASLPRLAAAIALVLATIGTVCAAPRPALAFIARASGFLLFVPPFVFPFFGLALLLQFSAIDTPLQAVLTIACLALPPAALVAAQAAGIMARYLESAFAISVRARGASLARQRWLLLPAVGLELLSTLEKLLIGLLTSLLFVEPILGQSGFGALLLRAIRRSDLDLCLAIVLFLALLVNTGRLVGNAARERLGGSTW